MDCRCRANKITNVVAANEEYLYCIPLASGVILLLCYYIIRLICFFEFKENFIITEGGC